MEAIAELPDGDPHILPQGNWVVKPESHNRFFNDLHETIVAQVLDGRTSFMEIIDSRRVIFRLPGKEQIHDYISFHLTNGHVAMSRVLNVVLKIPSAQSDIEGNYDYHTEIFEYTPPERETPEYRFGPTFSRN